MNKFNTTFDQKGLFVFDCFSFFVYFPRKTGIANNNQNQSNLRSFDVFGVVNRTKFKKISQRREKHICLSSFKQVTRKRRLKKIV